MTFPGATKYSEVLTKLTTLNTHFSTYYNPGYLAALTAMGTTTMTQNVSAYVTARRDEAETFVAAEMSKLFTNTAMMNATETMIGAAGRKTVVDYRTKIVKAHGMGQQLVDVDPIIQALYVKWPVITQAEFNSRYPAQGTPTPNWSYLGAQFKTDMEKLLADVTALLGGVVGKVTDAIGAIDGLTKHCVQCYQAMGVYSGNSDTAKALDTLEPLASGTVVAYAPVKQGYLEGTQQGLKGSGLSTYIKDKVYAAENFAAEQSTVTSKCLTALAALHA